MTKKEKTELVEQVLKQTIRLLYIYRTDIDCYNGREFIPVEKMKEIEDAIRSLFDV